MDHSHGVQRKKRPLPQSLWNWSSELAPFLASFTGRWERSLLPFPSVSGTFVPFRMHTHTCVLHIDQAETTKLLNSAWSAMPRVRTLPHPGRGSSKSWKEPQLYRLILPWISCLPRLPNLTSEKPSFTFYESGQLQKRNPISYQAVIDELFGCMWPRLPPPISVLCLGPLNVGCREADQKVLACPKGY